MKLIAFLALLLLSLSVLSQKEEIDTCIVRIEAISGERKKAIAYDNAANLAWETGRYANTLTYTKRGLKIAEDNNFKDVQASLLNNRGIAYDYLGDYTASLTNYFKALRIQEKLDDRDLEAQILSNIGLIYSNQELTDKALFYHNKALKINTEIDNIRGISVSLNNIAIIYSKQDNFEKAIENYLECIRIDKIINDERGLGDDYNNIGICYMELKQFDKAMIYFMQALEIGEKINNPHGIIVTYTNIASNYLNQRNLAKAREYFLLSIPISTEIGNKESLKYAYENLYLLEDTLSNTAAAYGYYKLYVSYKDSIDNTDHARMQTELELNYNYDKEKERLRLLQEKKEERATIILYSVVGVLFLILVFSVLLYKRWKYAQQQQAIIEEKNELVQLKNDEILDSINYAKRIQTAILPSSEQISALFPNHFVTFLPKDIVAGDFYWLEETPNHIFIAAADCTGHGVPGAMMSVVCHNALNRSVKEFQLTQPGEILDKTREIIIEELSKSEQQVRDGMDISLCVIDRKKKEMRWAGANNPLWVYRTAKKELEEWKGDKQPIGSHWELQPFTSHVIPINSDDRFYLFSDGYVDQFGGPHGKKLMSKVFKQLILDSAHMDLIAQQHYLEAYFNDWKGDLPQVDDVCLICITLEK